MSNYNEQQSESMKNLVLLDSNSTNTIFCNEQYVTNIRQAEKPLKIHTNGGSMMVTQKYKILHLGTHWFNRNTFTNMADISKMFRVTMDTKKEKILIVHMDDKTIKFSQMPGGLHAKKTEENSNNKNSDKYIKLKDTQQSYLTVKDNYKFVSNRLTKKSQEVKRL